MIPLSDIVLIVFRMLVLNWGLFILVSLVSAIIPALRGEATTMERWMGPLILLGIAIVGWVLAPLIAKMVTPKKEFSGNVGGLTRRDLYAFAFVFLGLYFCLNSVSGVAIAIYSAMPQPGVPATPMATPALLLVVRHVVTLIVGGFVLLFADRWARLILAKEDSGDAMRSVVPGR